MDTLRSLVEKAEREKSIAESIGEQIRQCHVKLTGLQNSRPDPTSISIDDLAAMTKVAIRSHAIELIPQQIEELDLQRGNALAKLLNILGDLKSALRSAARTEQQKFVKEIAQVLRPYSIPIQRDGETLDPAVSAAWGLPIVLTIGQAVAFTTAQPATTRAAYPESFDRAALEYGTELLGIANRYLASGTFVPPNIFPKKT